MSTEKTYLGLLENHQKGGVEVLDDNCVKVKPGHMALLPEGAAYQFRNNGKPGVLLVQTLLGENTVERSAEICQTK